MSAGGYDEKVEPHYDLERVKRAFRDDDFVTPQRVKRYLTARGWSHGTICEVVARLKPADLHKSQAHRERPGVWLDIYRPSTEHGRLYVKFTMHEDGRRFVVLSFCRDGEVH